MKSVVSSGLAEGTVMATSSCSAARVVYPLQRLTTTIGRERGRVVLWRP
jgi:hypothetical protein